MLEVATEAGHRFLVRFTRIGDELAYYEHYGILGKSEGYRGLTGIAKDWAWALRTEEDWLCAVLEDRYDP